MKKLSEISYNIIISVFNEMNTEGAQPKWIEKSSAQAIDNIFEGDQTGFLDLVFAENSRLEREKFVEVLSKTYPQYLYSYEQRLMVFAQLFPPESQ